MVEDLVAFDGEEGTITYDTGGGRRDLVNAKNDGPALQIAACDVNF